MKPCPDSVLSDCYVFGFPCPDVSKLNINRADNVTGVGSGSGRTGGVFKSMVDFLSQDEVASKTLFLLCENVLGLATPASRKIDGETQKGTIHSSNLAACCDIFDKQLGMVCFPVRLDPRMFGTPQSRARFYLPAFSKTFLEAQGMSPTKAYEIFKHVMATLPNGYGLVPLESLMLPDTHPAVTAMFVDSGADGSAATTDEPAEVKPEGSDDEPLDRIDQVDFDALDDDMPLEDMLSAAIDQAIKKAECLSQIVSRPHSHPSPTLGL